MATKSKLNKKDRSTLRKEHKEYLKSQTITASLKKLGGIENIRTVNNLSNPKNNATVKSSIDDSKTSQISYPRIDLTLHSEHNTLNLVYDTSKRKEDEKIGKDITDGVISFQTKNALEDDSASFSIVLAGNYKWDYVVFPNDIITIKIYPNKSGISYAKDYNANIMTGMVTEVHRVGNYDSDSFVYQIAGKSMANAFMQYKIGLVEEVQSSISSLGWLWDTNMAYSAQTTTSDSSTSGSATNTTFSGKKVVEQLYSHLKSEGYSNKQIAAFLGSTQQESSFNPTIKGPSGNGGKYAYGLFQSDPETKVINWCKKHGYSPSSAKGQMLWFEKEYSHGGYHLSHLKSLTGSLSSMTHWMRLGFEGGTDGNALNYANDWYKKIKSGSLKYDGKVDDSDSGDSSDTKSTGSGNTNATEEAIKKEMGSSEGVSFLGNSCATIEKNILNRFLPYMRYTYGTKGWDLSHFLTYDDMTSWDDYEQLQDSSQFTNFSGSLFELQDAILHKPFVEMFYEMDANGKSHVSVRRTPFEPEDWNGWNIKGGPNKTGAPVINRSYITSSQIISEDVAKNNDEIFSVFNVNPATANYTGIKNAGELGSLPQFNQSLVNLYGYAKNEVTSLYLAGTNSGPLSSTKTPKKKKTTNKTKKDKHTTKKTVQAPKKKGKAKNKAKSAVILASHGTHYTAKDVEKYLKGIKLKTLIQKKSTYANKLGENANNLSIAEATSLVEAYLNDNKRLTQEKMNSIVNSKNGGGISATGSMDINYKSWLSLVKAYGSNEKNYMIQCKAMFDNADDEVLTHLLSQYSQNGNKLSQIDFKKYLKEFGVKSNSTKLSEGALDLKRFTQMLYNWYCEDINFYSGDITVIGSPEYRLGSILVEDNKYYSNDGAMEYYVESVEHTYSMSNGYQTIIGVTRGLGNYGKDRFTHLWGENQDFLGGYMGEAAMDSLAFATEPTSSGGKSNDPDVDGGDWGWPMGTGATFVNGQRFGDSRDTGVHDGVDFGRTNGGKKSPKVYAAHGGVVTYVGYDASWAHGMVVIAAKDYTVCYQEFSYNYKNAVKVKVGDTVKTGQHILNIDGSADHCHIGVVKGGKGGTSKCRKGSYSTKGWYDIRKLIKK